MTNPAPAAIPEIRPRSRPPAFAERFRFIAPALPPLEDVLALYEPAYGQGMITNSGIVARFEDAVAERLGVRHAVAVSSCTSGLMLVLRALGVTGEVVLPSFTFFATAHAGAWNGLEPVFAECDPETWTLCPLDAARKITPRTGAIVGVHLYGNPCDVDALAEVASRSRVKLIFDAAHAFGSSCQGRPVGRFGEAEVFSLSPTKLLVTGEGGLIATNDAALARRLRAGRNYGDSGSYDPEVLGLNARMPEFNAALGLAGLPMVDAKLERHNRIAAEYTNILRTVEGVGFQAVRPGNVCAYKDYSIHIDAARCGITRDGLRAALSVENIETRAYFFPAVHQQRLYARTAGTDSCAHALRLGRRSLSPANQQRLYEDVPPASRRSLRRTERLAAGILSLPIYHTLPLDTVRRVALEVRNAIPSSGATNP